MAKPPYILFRCEQLWNFIFKHKADYTPRIYIERTAYLKGMGFNDLVSAATMPLLIGLIHKFLLILLILRLHAGISCHFLPKSQDR